MRLFLLATFLGLPLFLLAQLDMGQRPPKVTLEGTDGGKVAGGAWHSGLIGDKVTTVMYVDPDAKEVNEHVERALKAENFPRDRYGSMAIVNAKATWKPDAVIKMVLKGKQKDYPDTMYVMDREKVLVKEWGLADDDYHVLTFDAAGQLLYSQAGKLNDTDVQKLIRIIRSNL